MEMRFDIPFQQLLSLVKALTPNQRERLRQELDENTPNQEEHNEFIDFLLKGPVYSKSDIIQNSPTTVDKSLGHFCKFVIKTFLDTLNRITFG